MVSGINSGISAIQLINATNAFKAASAVKTQEPAVVEPQVSEGTDINDSKNLLKNINVDEIKKYASMSGEENLSEEDIKYGLVYGRSVMADWVV